MAIRRWLGNATNVQGVYTITVTGTWVQGETVTVSIGDSELVVTVGSSVTVTDVANLIKEGINTGSLTDSTASTSIVDGASNKVGEFYDLEATSSAGVVTLTGATGIPYGITTTETSTSGSVADAVVTAATGKWFWDNAENWSDNTVPVDGDDVRFDSGNVSCRFNLDVGIQPASFVVTANYTGYIGLREINQDNTSLPFREYRQKSIKFQNDAGTATTDVRIGEGSGNGSSLIRIDFDDVSAYTLTVFSSGSGLDNQPAVMIADDATGSTNAINVVDGHVGLAYFDDETGRASTVNLGSTNSNGKIEIGSQATINDTDFIVGGGSLLIYTVSGNISSTPTLKMTDGQVSIDQGTAWSDVQVWGGTLTLGAVTIATNLEVGSGTLDLESDPRSKTITPAAKFYQDAIINDRDERTTWTAGWKSEGCTLRDITANFGSSRTYTVT